MGNGSSGGAQDGSQKGIALASGPSWAAGDRLTPQSVMKGMSVTPNIPTAPGTKVIAPDASSMPQAQSEVPSIAQSPLNIQPQVPSDQNTSTVNAMPTYSDWFGNPASKPGMIFSAQKTEPDTNSAVAQNPDQTTTQGTNPVSFANASSIQSALPQVQSTQSGAPASNATPNVAQAPSQPNPTQNTQNQVPQRDQNLDNASKWVLNTLEGSELTKESNGRYSRFGIGSDADEPLPKNVGDAQQFLFWKYINQKPDRQAILSQLTDPRDQAAYLQGLVLNPGPIDNFTSSYAGQVGGDAWRNAMLNKQKNFLVNLVNSNPQKYGQNLKGWMNRINTVRSWNPQQDNT